MKPEGQSNRGTMAQNDVSSITLFPVVPVRLSAFVPIYKIKKLN